MNVNPAADRPHPHVSFHPIASGAILFDAMARRLYALNLAAAVTWLCVRDGLSEAETTGALVSDLHIDDDQAKRWVADALKMFADCHLVGEGTPSKPKPVAEPKKAAPADIQASFNHRFSMFDQLVLVSAPDQFKAGILSLLGLLRIDPIHANRNRTPDIRIEITPDGDQWQIAAQGYVEADCPDTMLVAELERVLVETVVPATPHVLALHAASLQSGDTTLLLAAPSGSGKTTLSVALQKAGWTFGADEIVLLQRETRFRALPLPPCIKTESFALIENWFPCLQGVPAHERYGRTIKYLPLQSQPLDATKAIVVFPQFKEGAESSLTPLDGFEGLQKLLNQCVFVPSGFQADDVQHLQLLHEKLRYFSLEHGSCDAAESLLKRVCSAEFKLVVNHTPVVFRGGDVEDTGEFS